MTAPPRTRDPGQAARQQDSGEADVLGLHDGCNHPAVERWGVLLPWTHRVAEAWLRGDPVAVAPEDWPAVEAAARGLVTDKLTRLLEDSERLGPWKIHP